MADRTYELIALGRDHAAATRAAKEAAGLIRATGPVSYDFQFGTEGLLERVVATSWSAPGTLFAAANVTAAFAGEALAGFELGFAGGEYYRAKDNLAALASALIESGGADLDELMGLTARADEASYLNAHIAEGVYYVLALATVPAFRGKGAGVALLRAAIERARAAGMRELQLDVLADNPAVAFYRHHGLRVLSEVSVPRLSQECGFPSELRMGLVL